MFLFLLCLVAVSLACSRQVSTPVPTVEPTATSLVAVKEPTVPSTATSQWTATVRRALINVRAEPDGEEVIGHLRAGDEVTIIRCLENWCKIAKPAGWVYRGCLSDNPDKLGCIAREE